MLMEYPPQKARYVQGWTEDKLSENIQEAHDAEALLTDVEGYQSAQLQVNRFAYHATRHTFVASVATTA